MSARVLALVLVLALGPACSRKETPTDGGPKDTDTSSVTSPSTAPSTASSTRFTTAEEPSRGPKDPATTTVVTSTRTFLGEATTDPRLRANEALLQKHFADPAARRLAIQRVVMTKKHREALLVFDAGKSPPESDPIVLAFEADGTASFTVERPVAGIMRPVGRFALAPAPSGRLAMAICDPPTSAIALRLWDADGAPFADFKVLDVVGCDDVTVLHLPRRGWLVVATYGGGGGGARAQLVTESGTPTWGVARAGLEVGARGVAMRPALAADAESWTMVEAVRGASAGQRAYAFRYDMNGKPLWPAAVDLGEIPERSPKRKIVDDVTLDLVAAGSGSLAVTFDGTPIAIEVGPGGEVKRVAARLR